MKVSKEAVRMGIMFGLIGASLWSYTKLYSWQSSLLIVFMLIMHEMGHLLAMKYFGMKTRGIYLIPFIGGAAIAEGEWPSSKAQAVIALMGPAFGFVAAALCGGAYLWTGNAVFAAAASWMASLNLLNLIPVEPLDGGRFLQAVRISLGYRAKLVVFFLWMFSVGYFGFKMSNVIFVVMVFTCLWAFSKEEKRLKNRTLSSPMTFIEVCGGVAAYSLVSGVLWWLMAYIERIPGIDSAMKIFEG